MSQRLNDYLTREASDYLDQLRELLAPHATPDPERLLRLARGVRGSAQMAGTETVARVAERIEDAARSVLTGAVVWTEAMRALSARTVEDLQILLRALNRWGPDEEARVRSAIERWDELEGTPTTLRAVSGEGDVVGIASLFYDDEGPHVLSGPGADEPVPVESLLLQGQAALREALSLRPRAEDALQRLDGPELRLLLDEVFDLVALGLREADAGG